MTICCNGLASGLATDKESGSRSTIAMMRSVCVCPENGCRPATISYSTTPRLQTSVRASTGSPRACSGDIYATVPIATDHDVLGFDIGVHYPGRMRTRQRRSNLDRDIESFVYVYRTIGHSFP